LRGEQKFSGRMLMQIRLDGERGRYPDASWGRKAR
jgi:hypothetical protein